MKIAKRLKTGPKPSAAVAKRVARAKRLVALKWTYRAIGEHLGVSTQRAWSMVNGR